LRARVAAHLIASHRPHVAPGVYERNSEMRRIGCALPKPAARSLPLLGSPRCGRPWPARSEPAVEFLNEGDRSPGSRCARRPSNLCIPGRAGSQVPMNRLPNHSKAGESRSRTFPICQALRAGSFAGLRDASRYSGNAADRTEFLLSNERPCGRSGHIPLEQPALEPSRWLPSRAREAH